MDSTGEIIEIWDKEQLMSQSVNVEGGNDNKKKDLDNKLLFWGQPGHLTEEEADVYMKFKAEVETRDKDFKDTIYSFGVFEGEVYAYCRWLRARKYVLEDTIKMVEEATACRSEAKMENFYPDPASAIGCDTSLYIAQYPQLYSGFAKNQAPVFYSKLGVLNIDAVECVTTMPNSVKYHWYGQMHDFARRLHDYKEKNPDFKKFECVCVMDLEGLTMGQLTQRTLALVKEQAYIDSLCFPETMCKTVIVNAPRFFSATWKLIKGWLDARTASKVFVISNRDKWEEKLRELIDVEELPADYGGKGPTTAETIEKENFSGNLKRVHSEVIYVRGSGSATFEIAAGEELDVSIYTRSEAGSKFSIIESNSKKEIVPKIEIKRDGGAASDMPIHKTLTETKLDGPISIKVKAESMAGRFKTHNFLACFSVYRK